MVIALFLLVLAVLWFFLPFAIFGTKDKLSELIRETKKTNEELKKLRAEISVCKHGGTDLPAAETEAGSKEPPEKGKPWEHG